MPPYIITGYANRNTFVPLFTESNTSGRIYGIGISRAKKEHHFRITIDGRTVHEVGYAQRTDPTVQHGNNYFAYVDGGTEAHHGFTINFGFEDSIKVEIRDDQGKYPSTKFWAAYETEDRPEDAEAETEDGSEDAETEIEDEHYHLEDGLVYTTRTFTDTPREQTILQGEDMVSRVILEKDTYLEGEEIHGSIEVKDWEGNPISLEEVNSDGELIYRQIGRTHPIGSVDIDESMINTEEPIELIAPEYSGEFEVLTNFNDIANFPTEFSHIW